MPEAAAAWVRGLFGGAAQAQRLALPEAARLLMAVSPALGLAGLSDTFGLAGVADVLDVMNAQELIRDGEAAAASLLQDDHLIQLQLALQDGTEHIVTLFKRVTP